MGIKISAASVYSSEEKNKIYIVLLSSRDNEFPLSDIFKKNSIRKLNSGLDLDSISLKEIGGKFRNDLEAIINQALDYGLIVDFIAYEKEKYLVLGARYSDLKQILTFSNDFLVGYDEEKVVFLSFLPIAFVEETFFRAGLESFFDKKKFSILDIFKYFGTKNILILMLVPIIVQILIPYSFIEDAINIINGTKELKLKIIEQQQRDESQLLEQKQK